ncbi:ABC transporter substrate-binding protein [Patulibacter americanus]|uniref:ABC transporter substrate-binding protein n=1 Tax=Patulibacter americanus TaxID=588672 RepID=UPI00040C115E|nr:ABC transporter substrate-binding protein [Patulibacter americanus]
MRRHLRLPLTIAGLAVASIGLTACGGDDSSSSSSNGGSSANSSSANLAPGSYDATQKPAPGKKGGVGTMLSASDVDYMDPGQTYYQFAFVIAEATQRRLYYFEPNDATKIIPDLAEGEPEISEDNKTVTVKLKKGVKFSPPVDREITSKDVKYAISRLFAKNSPGGYTNYFDFITGAPDELQSKVPDISGIETPDDQTLIFKLDEPYAAQLVQSFVLPYNAPVPEEYAAKFDKKNPSTYQDNLVATGPYMVKNDAKGKVDGVGWKKTKSIELVRNPNWDEKTDFRPAYADGWKIKTDVSDANVAARQVLDGSHMLLDTNPPANILEQLATRIKDQYTQTPSGGFRYFSMNNDIKPFDDVNVRRAVIAGFNRDAARKARGGKFVGPIPTHYLTEGFPGYEEAGGEKGFDVDFMNYPKGNAEVSAKYFKAAGFASGKYEGGEELLMIGANADPGKAAAQVAANEFKKMGFKVRLRLVPQDAVYNEWCGQRTKKVAICGTAGWFKDFNDASTLLQVPFYGGAIPKEKGQVSYNLSFLNDPAVNAAVEKALPTTGDERLKAWAEVDKAIVMAAPAVPFVADKTTSVRSKDVAGVPSSFNSLWDLNFTSLK